MHPMEPIALSEWLDTIQDYRVTPATAERIGRVVGRFKKVEQTLGTDTLFWTEPANMSAALTALSPTGADDE